MSIFQEIWNVLLDIVTLGAERGNPFALGVLLLAGVAALLAGRQLFWLVAAVVGYLLGSSLASLVAGPFPFLGGSFSLTIGAGAALLALAAQGQMARLITFVATGLLVLLAASPSDLPGWAALLLGAGGGVLGVVLLSVAYDEVLIVLSAFYGAVAVLGVASRMLAGLALLQSGLFFAGMLAVGLLVQFLWLRHERLHPLVIPASAGGMVQVERRARRFRRGRMGRRVPRWMFPGTEPPPDKPTGRDAP